MDRRRYFKEQVRKTLRGSNVNKIMQERYGFNPKAMLDYNRRSQIFKERAMERYLEAYEEPETEQGYDFNILLQLAKEEEAKVRGEARSDDPNPIQD